MIDNGDNEDEVDVIVDVVCEVVPAGNLVDAVKVVDGQTVNDDNGNDDAEGCALRHAKENAS